MKGPVFKWPVVTCSCGGDHCDLRPATCCNKFVTVRKKWPKACSGYHDHVKSVVGVSKKAVSKE